MVVSVKGRDYSVVNVDPVGMCESQINQCSSNVCLKELNAVVV